MQNGKRRRQSRDSDGQKIVEQKGSACETKEGQYNEEMVAHVRMVTSLIEGRKVSWEEILQMLERAVRQHSIGRERRVDYIVRHMKEHPR